mmetsp:Transcript_28579/g.62516  ORF Transcript_28579/g.62516 Transcript_28579/m.62516 type:complete len:130 (-) Transcript_28579:303-692(-)
MRPKRRGSLCMTAVACEPVGSAAEPVASLCRGGALPLGGALLLPSHLAPPRWPRLLRTSSLPLPDGVFEASASFLAHCAALVRASSHSSSNSSSPLTRRQSAHVSSRVSRLNCVSHLSRASQFSRLPPA